MKRIQSIRALLRWSSAVLAALAAAIPSAGQIPGLAWEQIEIPLVGEVADLEFDAANRLYARVRTGVYVRSESGNWGQLFPATPAFAASRTRLLAVARAGGEVDRIVRTENPPTEWEQVDSTAHGGFLSEFVVRGDTVLAVIEGSWLFPQPTFPFLRSVDDGRTWSADEVSFPDDFAAFIDLTSDGILWAIGRSARIWRSRDLGRSWERTAFERTALLPNSASLTGIFAGPSEPVYVSYSYYDDSFTTYCGMLRSDAAGDVWTDASVAGHCVREVTTDGAGRVLAATDGGLFLSDDAGVNWIQVESAPEDLVAVEVATDGQIALGHATDGVLTSADGGASWEKHGLEPVEVQAAVVIPGGLLLSTRRHGLYRYGEDAHAPPTRLIPPEPLSCFAASPDGRIFAGADHGVYVSADAGSTWEKSLDVLNVRLVEITPEGTVLAGYQGLYAFDGGTWTPIEIGNGFFDAVATHHSWGIVAAVRDGLYRSRDDGRSWLRLPTPIALRKLTSTGEGVLAGTSIPPEGVYVSFNGGVSFTPRGLEDQQISAVGGAGKWVLAGTSSGDVYMLDPVGDAWLDAGLGADSGVLALLADGDGHLVVATWHGVFRSSAPVATSTQTLPPEVSRRAEAEIYPNPASELAQIRLVFHAPGAVRVTAYDLLGRRVERLVDGILPAGMHSAEWDVRGVPAGTYLLRIDTPDGAWAKSLTVVR